MNIEDWVNPKLLSEEVQLDLCSFFEENSSVALLNFLVEVIVSFLSA